VSSSLFVGKYCSNKCLQGLKDLTGYSKLEVEWDRRSIPQLLQEIELFPLSLIKDPIAQDSSSKEKILSISFSQFILISSSSYISVLYAKIDHLKVIFNQILLHASPSRSRQSSFLF
jgi:hypothetical protein